MKNSALIYVPSDTPEAMSITTAKVAGVPLIVRGIMTLADAGVESIALLMAESQRQKVERFLERYGDKKLPSIDIITYAEPYRVSSDIVKRIVDGAAGRLLMINGNLIFEKELLANVRRMALRDGRVLLCEEGAHRIPVIDITPAALATLIDFTEQRPRSIESCLAQLAELAEDERAKLPVKSYTFLLKSFRDRAVAEKALAESIRLGTPGPVARYINKRISLPISLFLSKLWVSPNSITGFNIILGVFAGVFAADGSNYWMILLGAGLFQAASIVDGCDGEAAKLTFRCSKFGQYADTLSDNLSLGSMLTGIMAGYWRSTHSPIAFYVGAIMLATTGLTIFWIMRYLKRNTQSASLATFDTAYLQKLSNQPRWLLAFIRFGKYTLKKDAYSFFFLVFAAMGVLYWWLFIVALGTTIAAAILTYLNAQEWLSARSTGRAMPASAKREAHSAC